MNAKEAEEVFALRLKIEPDAAAFASKAAGDADRKAAEEALRRLVVAAAAHEATVGALNRAFLLALVRPGGQQVTTNVVRGLHIIADRYVRKHLEPHSRHLRAESEHQEILDAWLKPDARKVRKLLYEHLERTLKDLRLQLAEEASAAPKESPSPAGKVAASRRKARNRKPATGR
jgi:DNA-binding GntR family transcriptional regulator